MEIICYNTSCSHAGVAHPVERHLAKVEVASSSLVARSIKNRPHKVWSVFLRYDCKMKAIAVQAALITMSSHATMPMMVRIVKNSAQFLMVFSRDSFL